MNEEARRKQRDELALGVSPLAAVPVALVASIATQAWIRSSSGSFSAGLLGTLSSLVLILPLAYLVEFVIALPVHRQLRLKNINGILPYIALGAGCGAAPFIAYALIAVADVWPTLSIANLTTGGVSFGLLLAILGVPFGVAVATTFWWIAVRPKA